MTRRNTAVHSTAARRAYAMARAFGVAGVCVVLVVSWWGHMAPPAAAATTCPTTSVAGRVAVAVVVDFGALASSSVEVRCVTVAEGSNGVVALKAAFPNGLRWDSSGLLCAIDLLPAAPACGEVTDTGYQYWAYHYASAGSSSWTYASVGPASHVVANGSVEGWRFRNGGPATAAGAQPSVSPGSISFAAPTTTTAAPATTTAPSAGTSSDSGGTQAGSASSGSTGATGASGASGSGSTNSGTAAAGSAGSAPSGAASSRAGRAATAATTSTTTAASAAVPTSVPVDPTSADPTTSTTAPVDVKGVSTERATGPLRSASTVEVGDDSGSGWLVGGSAGAVVAAALVGVVRIRRSRAASPTAAH